MGYPELNNATLPTMLDRPTPQPAFMKLQDRSEDASANFLRLLEADHPGNAGEQQPVMFGEDTPGLEQTLIDRLTAVRPVGNEDKDELREAAEQLVSTTFIMPLFDKLRSDPLAANMFHGGQAETMFGRQLDQHLSDRIAGGSNLDIVNAIYEHFSAYSKAKTSPTSADAPAGTTTLKGVDLHG